MNRINKTFIHLRLNNEKAFIPFFVIGDPTPSIFLQIIKEIEPIADIIELGIPFSDPIADGPVIQEANKRAFSNKVNFRQAIELIKSIRTFSQKPIVVLTYANVVGLYERMKSNIQIFSEIGVDGIVVADMPIEESGPVVEELDKYNIFPIFLAAPTTTEDRLREILKHAKGFLYVVAVKGVTGVRDSIKLETKNILNKILKINDAKNPVSLCVGFGISSPEHVKEVISFGADGVIVGSAIVKIIEEFGKTQEFSQQIVEQMIEKIKDFVKKMKEQTK